MTFQYKPFYFSSSVNNENFTFHPGSRFIHSGQVRSHSLRDVISPGLISNVFINAGRKLDGGKEQVEKRLKMKTVFFSMYNFVSPSN